MRGFLLGLSGYLRSLPAVHAERLWRYFLIGSLVAAGVGVAAVALIVVPLAAVPWGSILANYVLLVALAVAAALLLIFFKRIVLVASAPWMGPVAERVGAYVSGEAVAKTAPSSGKLLLRSLRFNLRLAAGEFALTVPLLLLGLIPVLNVAAAAALLAVQAYFLGAGALDYALEPRLDYRASLAYVRAHRGLALGLGAGFLLLTLTGVGFLVAPAFAAAAAGYAYARASGAGD